MIPMNNIKSRYINNKNEIITLWKNEYKERKKKASKTLKGKLHIIGLMQEKLQLEHYRLWREEPKKPTISFGKVYKDIEDYQLENNVPNFFDALEKISINLSPQDEKVQTIALSTDEAFEELKQYFKKEREAIEPTQTVEESIDNPEHTARRQVLAIYFMMKELGIYANSDKTELARFIQFLTGKETNIKEIKNTNIYKYILNPLPLKEKALNNDLNYIREYFSKMDAANIIVSIDKEKKDSIR
jgi:hypothetical protein